MSELKHQLMLNKEMSWVPCYLKSEADKVIEEKDAKIARLNDIRRVHVEAIVSMEAGLIQDNKDIRHQKYKRCLAMARWCWYWANYWDACIPSDCSMFILKARYYRKWHKRWLELAEKFKPNNSTAQYGKGKKYDKIRKKEARNNRMYEVRRL